MIDLSFFVDKESERKMWDESLPRQKKHNEEIRSFEDVKYKKGFHENSTFIGMCGEYAVYEYLKRCHFIREPQWDYKKYDSHAADYFDLRVGKCRVEVKAHVAKEARAKWYINVANGTNFELCVCTVVFPAIDPIKAKIIGWVTPEVVKAADIVTPKLGKQCYEITEADINKNIAAMERFIGSRVV